MKIKPIAISLCLAASIIMAAGSAYAWRPGPALGLGALGTAIGFAATGDARAAAIGGAAGLVTGMAVGAAYARPAYYGSYRAPPPPPRVYYQRPARVVVYEQYNCYPRGYYRHYPNPRYRYPNPHYRHDCYGPDGNESHDHHHDH